LASPKTGTPFCFFPFAASSLLTLAKVSQGIGEGGLPTNHKLSNQEVVDKHQLFDMELDVQRLKWESPFCKQNDQEKSFITFETFPKEFFLIGHICR
jgi:hypothetical protein